MEARKRYAHVPFAVAAAIAFYACAPGGNDNASATADDGATAVAEERAAEAPAPAVPVGTELTFVIDETLSTDNADAGRMFDAHLANAVRTSDGATILAAGTAARGMVVESAGSTGSDDPAVLVIRIETVEFEGDMAPIDGTVLSADIDAAARDTGAETAGKIAIGAAAGAIIGQIIGKDTESTLAGAGAGAIAGTVVALTTRDGDATLPAGSTVVVRLDQPLRAN